MSSPLRINTPTFELDPWRLNKSTATRDSFRKTKYRSHDPLSKRPLARASVFFSENEVNPGGLLAGFAGTRRSSQRFSVESPFAGGRRKNEPLALQAGSPTGREASFFSASRASKNPSLASGASSLGGAPLDAAAASLRFGLQFAAPVDLSTAEKGGRSSSSVAVRILSQQEESALASMLPSVHEDSHQAPLSMVDVVRLCPTPSVGSRITSPAPPLHSSAPLHEPTFSFPSLTADPVFKRRCATPVVRSKTSIARLMAENSAFVGFYERPVPQDVADRATSSLR